MEGLPQATVRIVESNNRRADASAAQPFGRRDSRAAAEVVWFLTVSSVVGPVVRDPCKTEFLRQSVDARATRRILMLFRSRVRDEAPLEWRSTQHSSGWILRASP